MTKRQLQAKVSAIADRHPVHALPMIVQVLTELVARVPDDPAPRGVRAHVHKRFVPIDLTPKEPA